jgi:UDP-N-acetyl-D-glucosamine dehydrogenase
LTSALSSLLARFADRPRTTVGVVGLGYVGLPLVRAMHDAGFGVLGYDIDQSKIDLLRAGKGYLHHLGDELFATLAASPRFAATTDARELARCDAVCVCVPTPLGKHNDPDLSYVFGSMALVAQALAARKRHARDQDQHAPMLVSLESTTYPGTTREVMDTIFTPAGLVLGTDYFLCFSPEREDPGRAGVATSTIPRVLGGVDDASTQAGVALYSAAVRSVVPVRSADVAEASKLLENIYRSVNIALVNELKPVFMSMGIDIWEVLDAASTKPFGFQRFSPGPGLGGHCIPIDPYYLTWKAREFGHATRFIELAGEINSTMPAFVVSRVRAALNDDAKPMRGSRVLVLGIAYKPNIDDIRETPAAEIITLLQEDGASVSYHDPHVPRFPSMRKFAIDLASVPLTPRALQEADCVVIVTDHDAIDWTLVGTHARLVVDSRNAMARAASPRARIVKA